MWGGGHPVTATEWDGGGGEEKATKSDVKAVQYVISIHCDLARCACADNHGQTVSLMRGSSHCEYACVAANRSCIEAAPRNGEQTVPGRRGARPYLVGDGSQDEWS